MSSTDIKVKKLGRQVNGFNTQLSDMASEDDYSFGKSVNIVSSIVDDTDTGIVYSGTWSVSATDNTDFYNNNYHISNTASSYVQFTFTGVGVKIYDSISSTRGIVEVFLDGVSQGTFDRYSSTYYYNQKLFVIDGLTDGTHTIKIVITGTKNTSSTDYKFTFDYYKVISKNTKTLSENIIIKAGKPNTVYVAASNSSEYDRIRADYVCDGVNDEVELQKAIDFFSTSSGHVHLCNGDYYIDALYNTGYTAYGKYALVVKEPNNTREIIIEGTNAPIRDKTSSTLNLTIAPVIHLRQAVYDALTTTELVTIIGSVPTLTTGDIIYPGISLIVKNVGITIPNNKKAITLIDGKYASTFKVDSIVGCIASTNYSGAYSSDKLPVIACVGIRGLQGYNYGEGYRMDNCLMYGLGIGYSICGEHLVANNLAASNCLWGFAFGMYDDGRVSAHPNTLINCCSEQCVNNVLFGSSSAQQSISIIDFNMEVMPQTHGWAMNGAMELNPGQFHGRITYSATTEDYTNSWSLPFWANGYGTKFETINTRNLLSGTTAQRTPYPNLFQRYNDTDLNKEIRATTVGKVEVDTVTITASATTAGNISITLNGVATTVAVSAGDTAVTIANKIRATLITNWVANNEIANIVTFTKTTPGICATPVFSGGATGATATFVATIAGTANVWMDAMGTVV